MSLGNGPHSVASASSTQVDEQLAGTYRSHHAQLVRQFRRRGIPRHEADDLAQETVLRALVHLKRHGRKGNDLGPLMRTIGRNLLVERVRRLAPAPVPLSDGLDLVDPTAGPEDSLIASERRASVRRALVSLNPRHRRAVELWMGGRTPAEIAHELGVKRNAADAILHRARRSLASKLEGRVASVVLPAFYFRLRARVRRAAEVVGGLDPAGAVAPAASMVAMMSTIAAMSLAAPQASTGTGNTDADAAPAPLVEDRSPLERAPRSSDGGSGDIASEQTADVPNESGVVMDLRDPSGHAGKAWTDTHGEDQFIGLEWTVNRDDSGHRGFTERLVDRTGRTACDELVRTCDTLSGQ